MGTKFFYRDIDLVYFVNNKLINSCTSTAYPEGITERYAPDLINQKDRMLLSFSGGQDSICFVFILNQLYCQLELDITFFWCHHLWQTDSFYLMQEIAKLSFLFQFTSCFPIPLSCISSELLARKWRQSCSYRVSLFYNYSKICLAHTFNDKIENIFLNFIRGTGLIGLTPLRWIQLTKRISKPNIILNNFINTAYSFFCIPPSGVHGKQRKGNGLQIKDLYLLRNPLQVASPHISFPYKSSDKSSSRRFATCKGLRLEDLSEDLYGVSCTSIRRTPLFLCRRTNSSCVIIDSKRNNQVIVLTNKRSLPFRGYGGMVPTKWNRYHNNLVIPPAIAFSLRGDPCAVPRENPTKKYISQHNYLKLTPYKSSDKSSSRRFATCKGLRLEDLSEDLYGNEMCGLATCKGCSYSNSSKAWKLNGSEALEMCIPSTQGNFNKLKNLTKKVIRKFIQKGSHTPLEKDKPLLCHRSARQKSMCGRDKATKARIALPLRVLAPLTPKGLRRGMRGGSTRVTNEYKAKPFEAFTLQPTPTHTSATLEGVSYSVIRFANDVVQPLPNPERVSCASKAVLTVQIENLLSVNKIVNDSSVTPFLFGTTPYKSSYKSSSLNPLQIEDLYGVSLHVRHPPQRIPLRNPFGVSCASTASTVTCKEYALEGNVMCGLNKPLSKTWGKQLRDGCYIVRPLLAISRIELNKICYFWELPIYPDKSNQKVKFLRNRVRGQLLPTIKLFFNLNIENIFLQLAKIIEAEDYCLTQIVNEFMKNTDVYHTKLDIYSKRKNN